MPSTIPTSCTVEMIDATATIQFGQKRQATYARINRTATTAANTAPRRRSLPTDGPTKLFCRLSPPTSRASLEANPALSPSFAVCPIRTDTSVPSIVGSRTSCTVAAAPVTPATPSVSMALRTVLTSVPSGTLKRMSLPPVKSVDKFRPRTNTKPSDTTAKISENVITTGARLTNPIPSA